MSTALIVGLSIGLGIPTLLLLRRAVKSNGRRDSTLESHGKNNPGLFEDSLLQRDSSLGEHVKNNSWIFNNSKSSSSEKSTLIGGKKTRKSRKK